MNIIQDKLIIWDYNRTVYDPDTDELTPGVLEVLTQAHKNGYINVLYSRNKANDTRVGKKVEALGIDEYFVEIVVRKEKNIRDIYAIINRYDGVDVTKMYLISDRVWTDIKMGNLLGLKTFWLCRGKFADQEPRNFEEEPLVVIKSLCELRGCMGIDFLI